jgi:hypothetical protein
MSDEAGEVDRYVVVNTATGVKESEPIEASRAKCVLFDIRERMDFDDAPPFSLKLRKVRAGDE